MSEREPNFADRHGETIEKHADSYFRLFRGGMSLLSQIKKESPLMTKAVEVLLKNGILQGQHAFTEEGTEDLLLWIPERRNGKNPGV